MTCGDYTTCGDCSSSSWGCHWCSFDEACHAVGSVHGCATGVNCYGIDRCQRLEPEKIEGYGGTFSRASFRGVGPVAWAVIGIVFGLVICCSSICFAGVTLLKGAVDDLVGGQPEMVEDGMVVNGGGDYQLLLQEERQQEERDNLEFAMLQNGSHKEDNVKNEGNGIGNREIVTTTHDQGSVTNLSRLSIPTMYNPAPQNGGNIKRMYATCQMCYIFTFITTLVLAITALSYAPRHPEYNVCTDRVAWKSIVEGMTALKMSASFDLLISVYNPNRWEVDLSNGAGQFQHDGEYVGSFTIPAGRISPQAISDIVVKVTLTPDKWSALSLTSEYYQGKLKFVVAGHSHVKIPGLGNYQFDAKFEDIEVNVNDPAMDDTHLCACPGWKKPGPNSTLLL
ncbi:hypothetical protein ACHAWO_007997 [Cyclotella atomus]|uniref:Late embryogenesis abundant protein LEA-2 subgroup domain-containing protein n=1 Tax=Cyclotella atomus TaxID=382360 RepID=A0ABD3NV65_9STRA